MAGSELITGRDWSYSFGQGLWGWFAAFLVLCVLVIGGMLAWWGIFGFWNTLFDPSQALGLSFDGRSHLTMGVLLAFVASGTLWVRRGALEDIQRLGESSGAPTEEIREALHLNANPPAAVRGCALAVSLVVGIVIIPLTSGQSLSSVTAWNMHHAWGVTNLVAIFFLALEGAWLSAQNWRTLHRYVTRHLSIDLLDRRNLSSIGRMGMRGAVLWLVGGTIASTLTWGMNQIAPLVAILMALLGFATMSLLLPALMVRGTLRDAKLAELQRIRSKIARTREAMLSGNDAAASEQAALTSGLLAYEARIESVREWPFDTPTLMRFGLLAVLAASSWLGGALVERALGVVLD